MYKGKWTSCSMVRFLKGHKTTVSKLSHQSHFSLRLINRIELFKREKKDFQHNPPSENTPSPPTQSCLTNNLGPAPGARGPRRQVVPRPTGTTSSATPPPSVSSRRTSSTGSTTPQARRMAREAPLLRHPGMVPAPTGGNQENMGANYSSVADEEDSIHRWDRLDSRHT